MSDTQENDTERRPEHLHADARSLVKGDRVIINDRKRPLTVAGQHSRPNYHASATGPYYVIELEGNGTQYHLLTWERASHGPMLYKESDWEPSDKPRVEYDYPRGGARVRSIKTNSERGGE